MDDIEVDIPDLREDEFLIAYGAAVLQWAQIENVVFLLFNRMLMGADHEMVSAAYHSMVSFTTGRLSMVDACMGWSLQGDPLLQDWAKLKKKLTEAAQRRNRLVHTQIVASNPFDKDKAHLVLEASYFDARVNRKSPIRLHDLNAFGGSFIKLNQEVIEFTDKWSAVYQARRGKLDQIRAEHAAMINADAPPFIGPADSEL